MADSVDRVFAHALNTVKRIPPLGSARPPPSDRYRLYGLYKQSMEGDVDRVMARPAARGEDQAKWDAWNSQKGLNRTEAKRSYISTLIETMHRYASHTPDARELVSELEFVWSQIKSNPPSSHGSNSPTHSNSNSNSHSYRYASRYNPNASDESPQSSSDPPIYPLMSEGGSKRPRADIGDGVGAQKATASDGGNLRVLSPMSQQAEGGDGEPRHPDEEDEADDIEAEDFVDAPDSQIGMNDADSPSDHEAYSPQDLSQHPPHPPPDTGQPSSPQRGRPPPRPPSNHTRNQPSAAGALIGPIAKYFTQARTETQKELDATSRWQRRMEAAMVRMNAEMAALREQMDWQNEHGGRRGSVFEGIVHPFGGGSGRRRRGVLRLVFDPVFRFVGLVVKVVIVDVLVLAAVVGVMHYRGVPVERLEEVIMGWIRRVQNQRVLQRLKRINASEAGRAASGAGHAASDAAVKYGRAIHKSVGSISGMSGLRMK